MNPLETLTETFGFSNIWLLVAVAIGLVLVSGLFKSETGRRRKAALDDGDDPHARAARQLEAVKKARYSLKPILNAEEKRVLPLIDAAVAETPGFRVIVQVSLGELLSTTGSKPGMGRAGYSAINAKRIDFGIVDPDGFLRLAIEYQGSGHDQGNAALRDAVKRAALRKAGVEMLEVAQRFDPDMLRQDIVARLTAPTGGRRDRLR